MDVKILYHGSTKIIKEPTIRGGRETNDYGYGFYCTENIELANEWACPSPYDGYTNRYEFDMRRLHVLDLTKPQYNILNWMAILLQFRIPQGISINDEEARQYILNNFSIDLTNVDVIIGYRADDSYFSFAREFLRNNITIRQLSRAMELGKLGIQIVLHSEKAFKQLKYIESIKVDGKIYHPLRETRDSLARQEYQEIIKKLKVNKEDLFIMDIIRQEVKNDDPRIQRALFK